VKRCYDWVDSKNASIIKSHKAFATAIVGKVVYGFFMGCNYVVPFIKRDVGLRIREIENPFYRWVKLFKKISGAIGL
jgi:hypothetical protein